MTNQNSIVVLGASPNPMRTSYLAAKVLLQKGYDVSAYGNTSGKIDQLNISNEVPQTNNNKVDAITIFMKPEKQRAYYDYILALNPKRIIFNPGTENPELSRLAREQGIETEIACTLVQLSIGEY